MGSERGGAGGWRRGEEDMDLEILVDGPGCGLDGWEIAG